MSLLKLWLPGAMVARLASMLNGTKRLQVRVLRWSLNFSVIRFWLFYVDPVTVICALSPPFI